MTSLDSSEEDVSGSFGGWEGCYFWSFCLFCGTFLGCVCSLCALFGEKVLTYLRKSHFLCSLLVPI